MSVCSTMRLTLVFLLAWCIFAQDKPADKAMLSGNVVDAATGQPLIRVTVFAEPIDSPQSASAMTDGKGGFKLVNLEPGLYKLRGERNGYLRSEYGAKRADGTGSAVTVAAGQEIKDLQLRLFPFGVLAGTVRETDGEPLVGIEVQAFRQVYEKGRRQITAEGETKKTDDLGQYRIPNLPPGRYYVQAKTPEPDAGERTVEAGVKDAPKQVLIQSYYPGVTDADQARLVDLGAGARLTGVDIAMARSRGVKVTVKVSAPPKVNVDVKLASGREGSLLRRILNGDNKGNGLVEFRDVPPGSYSVTATAQPAIEAVEQAGQSPSQTVTFSMSNNNALRTSVPLEVGNTDIDGVHITLAAGSAVKGKVVVLDKDGNPEKPAADKPASETVVMGSNLAFTMPTGTVSFEQNGDENAGTGLDSDGTFEAMLGQGRYHVYADYPGMTEKNLVIRSITAERMDVLRSGLSITGPGTTMLEIVLAPEGGTVEGTATGKDDKPAVGATVVLVPSSDLRGRYDRFFDVTTDQYGHFEFKNVPPGDYKILAWDDIEQDVWYDPDFLRSVEGKADSVTLKAKGHETMQVRLQAQQ